MGLPKKSEDKIERVLVLSFSELPDDMRQVVRNFFNFRNDCLIEYKSSDFGPDEGQTWSSVLYGSTIEECLERGRENGFQGNLTDYVRQYEPFLAWAMESEHSLDVTRILIDISW